MRIMRTAGLALIIALGLVTQLSAPAAAETRGAAASLATFTLDSDPGDPGLPPDP